MAMEYQWHDLVGIVGVAAIIISYLLLQLGKLDGRSLAYSAANAVGAGLVLVSLAFDFNLSAFVIESFWVIISVVGIARSIRARSSESSRTGTKSSGTGTQRSGVGTRNSGAGTQGSGAGTQGSEAGTQGSGAGTQGSGAGTQNNGAGTQGSEAAN